MDHSAPITLKVYLNNHRKNSPGCRDSLFTVTSRSHRKQAQTNKGTKPDKARIIVNKPYPITV